MVDLKGKFQGNCNRTACQAPGATWYNHSTRLYYCEICAGMINKMNHVDSMRLFGHKLCTPGMFSETTSYVES